MNDSAVEPLFRTTFAALTYAYAYSSEQYDPPAMAKLMRGHLLGSGKGLVGLDGAAQAGFVRREVFELPLLHQHIITARVAPRTLPCNCRALCCSGWRPNPEWADAITYLTREAIHVLAGCVTHYRLRRRILEKHFGVELSIAKLADECGVSRDAAGEQNAKIVRWLKGDKPTKHATKRVENRQKGEEERALERIDQILRDVGLVG